MAKLSAYGRTKLAQVSKENNCPNSDLISWERTTYVLMSDGKILEKRDVRFKPSTPYDPPEGRKHTYNWKLKSKLKEGVSADQWSEAYIKKGWNKE